MSLVEPAVPEGYEYVFGPTGGANNAPGYMGFTFIDRYDVGACAQLCNNRGADPNGGVCQYFNIWRALVNGIPTTYTFAFYYIPTNNSTACTNYVIDGGFEGFQCGFDFCFATSYSNWVGRSDGLGVLDATIFHYTPYAHADNGSGLIGSADGTDSLSGTLTPAKPLETIAGKNYTIALFSSSAYSGSSLEANAFWSVLWNGHVVQIVNPGFSDYTFYSFNVQAIGNDVLALHGGSAPAWTFVDDIGVFQI
ncbi:hypothetical protein M422DRAFT_270497 [Sphaerobolus stellatus SS14]|uniref:Uncharacterized protein n=1 Tax=Sphaerobolus stellatus (strain SS14) TaxID=990650 RepID=A0A0C9UH13_SPHS4|nr:hypothetical protein M422DRAFT_270497 [Sphaerobolus stellatus SS14]